MIGWVHIVLMDLLDQLGGRDLQHAVLEAAGQPRDSAFRLDRNYPDGECMALLDAAIRLSGLDAGEFHRRYARRFMLRARSEFPGFFPEGGSSRDLLAKHQLIHGTFAASLASPAERADVQRKFSVTTAADVLRVEYASPNLLCPLYLAMVDATAEHFSETVSAHVLRCRRRDPAQAGCSFEVRWP